MNLVWLSLASSGACAHSPSSSLHLCTSCRLRLTFRGHSVGRAAGISWLSLHFQVYVFHILQLYVTECSILGPCAYALVRSWEPIQEDGRQAVVSATPLVEVPFDPPWRATPSIAAAANSPERHTGSWRQFRPVLHPEHCTRCWVCFVRCPEAAISLDRDDYPSIDYDVCKGCLLCVHECPTHALSAEKEVR
jgi:2-oxoacid:acceptor oxidoreductase delta subunit (pyruvate/2-ketoisovalerate family)